MKNIYYLLIILIFSFFVLSCGEFLGFSDPPELDLGSIMKVRLYLTTESLDKLYESVSETDFIPCVYEIGDFSIDDLIVKANRIFNEVDRAIYYEPTNFFMYNDFLVEKEQILNFLYNRSYFIPDPIY